MQRALRTAMLIALILPARLTGQVPDSTPPDTAAPPPTVPAAAAPAPAGDSLAADTAITSGIDTMALRAYTYFLSGDVLEGRSAGTRGARAAALYIQAQLQRMGLEPAFNGRYMQPVPMARFTVDDERTSLAIADTDTTVFRAGTDFVVFGGQRQAYHDFSGSLVFLGLPQTALRENGRAGSLRGRIVTIIGLPGPAATRLVPDWIRRGAQGALVLLPDSEGWSQYLAQSSGQHYFLDAPVSDPIWQPRLPMIVAGPAVFQRVMAGVPVDAPGLRGERPFTPAVINRQVQVRIQGTLDQMPGQNVGAVLPGASPSRRGEYVALTAHLDHLGVKPGLTPDSIYNGFSDDAAGVAMSLAIAQALQNDPPARSVLFLYFTGEERGLLGSTYYTAMPAVQLRRTLGVVNLDAGAPPATSVQWRIAGGTVSSLGALADSLVRAHGWTDTLSDPTPNADYWPFLMHGVPAVFPIPEKNWEGVSPEQKQALLDRFEHYHDPADEWHADFPFVGMLNYAILAQELVRAAADAVPPPRLTVP